MAQIEHLITANELKTNLLAKLSKQANRQVFSSYDREIDALVFQLVPLNVHTIVHYIDDHVALLYQAEDLEIVGLRVEDFEHSFLPKHSAVERVWKLSDAGIKLENVGDMILAVRKSDRKVKQVAQEVAKVTEPFLGEKSLELVAAFA